MSCNGPKKNRIGRSVKKKSAFFFGQKCVFYACFSLIGSWEGEKNFGVGIFWSKMCVLCMFFLDWELGGRKKIWGRDFFE